MKVESNIHHRCLSPALLINLSPYDSKLVYPFSVIHSFIHSLGGAKGLLLNHLSVYNKCELIFDSSDAVDSAPTDNAQDPMININDLQSMFHSL